MKSSEILELVRAGYTKEEISALENPQDSQDNPQEKQTSVDSDESVTNGAQQEKQTSDDSKKEESENKPDSTLKVFQDSIKEMIQSNRDLMKVIQASNLNTDSHNNNVIDDINTKAEKALQSIIRPEQKEDKK